MIKPVRLNFACLDYILLKCKHLHERFTSFTSDGMSIELGHNARRLRHLDVKNGLGLLFAW